jgi:hypothetical protein
MRGIILMAALLAAVPGAAQQHQHGGQHQHGAQQGHAAHGPPAGWQTRLDRPNSTQEVHFMDMDGRMHAIMGPAAIFYNPANTATGAYRAQASFTQNRLSNHPEGYGLILGGRNLEAENQDYLYFLVRQDGKFLVKHRAGAETHDLFDWTEHAAIHRPDAQGRATNALAMQVTEAGVRFLINDAEVANLPRVPMLNTEGIAGLRINHNLDVIIDDFAVQPAQ